MVSSDRVLEVQLVDAGNKLLHPPSSSDKLLSLLDHVDDCLSRVEQSPRQTMQDALSTLQKALVACELLKHSEIDVQIAVASCISEIARISAPEAPYEDDVMKEAFQLIVSSFRNLSTTSSQLFVKRVSILETVAKIRSCVVMLDLECDSLIIEMFRHFLREIRDYHEENVFTSMETIMTLVIDESEDISSELLCPVLDSVKKDEKSFPLAKKLGEKVLNNCAKKLKPYLHQTLNSIGAKPDDYSSIVASICSGTNGVVEESTAHTVTDERSVSPPDGPASVATPNTIGNNGLTSMEKYLTDANNLKKEEDGRENVTSEESDDTNGDKQLDNDIAAKVELQPEQNSAKTGKEPGSSTEASNLVNDSMIAEEGSQKKEDQGPDSCQDQSISLTVLPAESGVEAAAVVPSSNARQNESTDAALTNQNDDFPTERKAHEHGPSKQEDEKVEDEFPSADLDENKTEDKKDLLGEVDAAKEGGMNDDSSSEENTLTAEDSVKDAEATSDSAATKSNQLKKKVNAKPEKRKGMSGRIDEGRETAKLPKKGKDALKSSKNSDKKEMVHPLKGSGKGKPRPVKTPKHSLKREDTPGKQEGNGAKKDGTALVGLKIKVWWPMDRAFYKGRVVDFDAVTKKHRILYFDGDVEVLSLRKEKWEIIKGNSGDEDEAVERESSDASPERPLKKAKLRATSSTAKHWDNYDRLWSSTRANGNIATSGRKRRRRLDDALPSSSFDDVPQSSNFPNFEAYRDVLGSPSFVAESSDLRRPDISGMHPSASSGRSSGKRKAVDFSSQDSDCRHLVTSMEELSRAMAKSADIIANRVTHVALPHPNSTELFNAVIALELPLDFRLDSYDYLSSNSAAAHKFLGVTLEFRAQMLQRIMGSR